MMGRMERGEGEMGEGERRGHHPWTKTNDNGLRTDPPPSHMLRALSSPATRRARRGKGRRRRRRRGKRKKRPYKMRNTHTKKKNKQI